MRSERIEKKFKEKNEKGKCAMFVQRIEVKRNMKDGNEKNIGSGKKKDEGNGSRRVLRKHLKVRNKMPTSQETANSKKKCGNCNTVTTLLKIHMQKKENVNEADKKNTHNDFKICKDQKRKESLI